MNITNTILTKTAVENTQYGNYTIEYTVINGKLDRVQMTIQKSEGETNGDYQFVGNIWLEQNNLGCNIPLTSEVKITPYFGDFDIFVSKIKENIAAKTEK